MRRDRAARREFARGLYSQPDLLVGAEQDDVRQRRLDRVADPPAAVRSRVDRDIRRLGRDRLAPATQVAAMRGVDRQRARERGRPRSCRPRSAYAAVR
ncbi:hypothetical protein QP185_06850 [Sphingomonas aerolata]|uniref:hypothetical protein n=1 Tax=Sphingomonas aerolata TaxID=185951 RepID=UPI002FE16414